MSILDCFRAPFVAASEEEMLKIDTAIVGDICERSDLSDYKPGGDKCLFILAAKPASDVNNWKHIVVTKNTPDDLAAANKLNEEYQFHAFGIGATVADTGRMFDSFAAHEVRECNEENARLRAKVKRLKRALKGALK